MSNAMPPSTRRTRVFIIFVAALFAISISLHQMYWATPTQALSSTIVISQVYGGGGNSGATLRNDFIELFNRGNTAVSLSGWSVQYASAAGTTWAVTNLTNVTLQPGQYYLVQEAAGAGGTTNLPPPNAMGNIAMSATAAKVALVNSTTALTGSGCPFGATVVDFIGYGGANCFEGAGATAALTNTTAALRAMAGCTETDNNATDFSAGSPNPRNTSSPTNVCGIGTPTPTPTPTLSVSNVTQAETNAGTTTFTFNVTLTSAAGAGGVNFTVNTADGTTNPANAGSDYVAIVNGSGTIAPGGTSTTVNVTVNGDTTPEPNETFFVILSSITGTTNTTAQGTGTITNDDVTITPIYTIQGSGMSSTFAGTSVSTSGIVTGRRSLGASNNGFYIQDPIGDGNVNTSDAILVFTGSTVPTVNVGDSVQVTGTVTEFESSTTDEPDGIAPPDPKTATEITGPSLTTVVLSSGNPLPASLNVTSNNILDPAATSRGAELEKYEYMRLSVSSLTVSEPTNNFGEFWGVEPPRPRPFREPGIEAGDPVPAADEPPYAPSPPPFPPSFDGNFERIMVDSGAALTTGSTRRAQVQVTTGTVVTNIVGPLDYAFDNYRIVLDASATPGLSFGVTDATPVPVRTNTEFTIAHANLENFGASNGDFADRLNKASLAIRNVLRTPDILGVIEVFDLASLQQLANKVNADAADPNVNYVAYLEEGAPNFGDDQDIGYLVNSQRVTVVGTPVQYHKDATFTFSGVTDILHDRPSYILTADVTQIGGATFRVTTVLNHTKSLIAVDSPRPFNGGPSTEGARNREKRRLQAEDIADLIETLQGDNLVVLGDLNAFEFNDGLTDVVGTLQGTPAPPEQVVEPSTPDRWTFQLTNLLTTLTDDQRYSYTFEGNAQVLDHVLVNNQMLARNSRFAYARYNADFSEAFAAISTRPERLSDHDAPVAYFDSPAPAIAGAGSTLVNESCPAFNSAVDPGERVTVNLRLTNTGNASTSNLVATLQASGGVVAPSGPQSYGAIAPNNSAGRDFSFTAAGTCGGTITATLQLQDGAINLGTVTYSFRLGVDTGNGFVCTSPCGGVRLVVTSRVTRSDESTVQAAITVQNIGSETANNVTVTNAKLGSTLGTPLPQGLGNLAPGATGNAVVTFANSTPGAASVLTVGGTYSGGTFSSTRRLTIP